MYNSKVFFVQFLLLVKAVTNAIPVRQHGPDPEEEQSTIAANIEPRSLSTKASETLSTENEDSINENDGDERFDISNIFKDVDLNVYKEFDEDGNFKMLCWAELLILTENRKNNNVTLSREFSISLESPGDIPHEDLADTEIISYELVEGNTKKSRVMNFTTVSRTDEFTVREHKTLFCGAGPILTKEYSEWPKLNKRKLEIRLTPTTPTVWRVCRKNVLLASTSTTTCNLTHDTTETNEILAATQATTVSESDTVNNRRNQIKMESTKSANFLSGETSNIMRNIVGVFPHNHERRTHSSNTENVQLFPHNHERGTQSSNTENVQLFPHNHERGTHSSKTENVQLSLDGSESAEEVFQQPEVESEVKLLRRDIYFRKLGGAEENMTDSRATENNFNPLDSAFLFDLIFPDKKVLTSLNNAEGKHKYLIKIKIELEHRVPNGANGQERTDYLIGLEENSVFQTMTN